MTHLYATPVFVSFFLFFNFIFIKEYIFSLSILVPILRMASLELVWKENLVD